MHHSSQQVILFRHPPSGDDSQCDADVPNLRPYYAREVRAIHLPKGEKLLLLLMCRKRTNKCSVERTAGVHTFFFGNCTVLESAQFGWRGR